MLHGWKLFLDFSNCCKKNSQTVSSKLTLYLTCRQVICNCVVVDADVDAVIVIVIAIVVLWVIIVVINQSSANQSVTICCYCCCCCHGYFTFSSCYCWHVVVVVVSAGVVTLINVDIFLIFPNELLYTYLYLGLGHWLFRMNKGIDLDNLDKQLFFQLARSVFQDSLKQSVQNIN